jgi:flagellar biosynthesis protein FlhG
MIIDTAAGISDSVVHFARAAGEVVVVVCDEPASIADAYALIKVLSRDYAVNKVSVISNQVESKAHGEMLFNQILKVINKYLDVSVSYLGAVPEDAYLKKAVKRQLAVTCAYPRSRSSEAFKEIAKKMNNRKIEEFSSGNLEFFAEQLININ